MSGVRVDDRTLPLPCWSATVSVSGPSPDRVVVRPYRGCLLADQLLDPSWLLGRYDLAIAAEMATADGRHAVSITGRRKTVRRGGDGAPESVEAVVDAERGFLHRFAGIGTGSPVETIELRHLRLDTPIDNTAFTVEPSGASAGRIGPRPAITT